MKTKRRGRKRAGAISETVIHTFVLQRLDFNPSLNETPLQWLSADLMKDLGFITANNAGHESPSGARTVLVLITGGNWLICSVCWAQRKPQVWIPSVTKQPGSWLLIKDHRLVRIVRRKLLKYYSFIPLSKTLSKMLHYSFYLHVREIEHSKHLQHEFTLISE